MNDLGEAVLYVDEWDVGDYNGEQSEGDDADKTGESTDSGSEEEETSEEHEYGMEESKFETKNDMRDGERMMVEAIENMESKIR